MAEFIEFIEHRSGQRNEVAARMLTKKEFVTLYEAKGMTAAWGDTEWNRRCCDETYKKGVDPECGLMTMQATVYVQNINFEEYSKGRRIVKKSREKRRCR